MNDLENRVLVLEGLISNLIKSDRYIFQKNIQLFDGRKIQFGKTTGTMLGTEITQKLGFYGITPVIQQTITNSATGGTDFDGAARAKINEILVWLRLIGLIN